MKPNLTNKNAKNPRWEIPVDLPHVSPEDYFLKQLDTGPDGSMHITGISKLPEGINPRLLNNIISTVPGTSHKKI